MSEQIGTYHLAKLPNLYTPATTNNFEFIVTDIDDIIKAGMLGNESTARISNAQEVLRISCDSSAVPHFTQAPLTINRGNDRLHFAGKPTFSDSIAVVYTDYIGAKTKEVLMAWQNLSYDVRTEKVGTLDVTPYKKECSLIEYTPDYRKIRTWKINGCWVQGISEANFDNNNNNIQKITANICYDSAWIDYSAEV